MSETGPKPRLRGVHLPGGWATEGEPGKGREAGGSQGPDSSRDPGTPGREGPLSVRPLFAAGHRIRFHPPVKMSIHVCLIFLFKVRHSWRTQCDFHSKPFQRYLREAGLMSPFTARKQRHREVWNQEEAKRSLGLYGGALRILQEAWRSLSTQAAFAPKSPHVRVTGPGPRNLMANCLHRPASFPCLANTMEGEVLGRQRPKDHAFYPYPQTQVCEQSRLHQTDPSPKCPSPGMTAGPGPQRVKT